MTAAVSAERDARDGAGVPAKHGDDSPAAVPDPRRAVAAGHGAVPLELKTALHGAAVAAQKVEHAAVAGVPDARGRVFAGRRHAYRLR